MKEGDLLAVIFSRLQELDFLNRNLWTL